ncbi:LicD family protein [Solibacillus sp. FSL K6-1523]|uniref:LicD family protein n=1 Tax=Solibacillus sp. FSL K6-1523 TaxID=2921471 RepID=UPI0030F66ADD
MENKQVQEVQQHCLLILKEIKRICDKNEIKYFLVGGSALGAYRHKGFIPWDDDIDIAIYRSQYQYFLDVCKEELSSKFFLQNFGDNQDFIFPFAKIRLNNTAYVDKDLAHLAIHHGLYIDVFPIDNIPENRLLQSIQKNGLKLCNAIRMAKLGLKSPSAIKNIILGMFKLTIPKQLLPSLYTFFMEMASSKETFKCGNVVGAYIYEKEAMPKSYFGKGQMMKFEQMECRVPENIKLFLAHVYGPSYMTLPPIDQRKTHNPVVVSFSENYEELEKIS